MDTITAIKKALEGVTPDAWRYRLKNWGEEYWHHFTKEPRTQEADEIWEPLYTPSSIAVTLETLQRENEELRSALKPYADKYEDITPKPKDIADGWAIHPDDMPDENLALVTIKIGDIRRARAALSSTGDTHGN